MSSRAHEWRCEGVINTIPVHDGWKDGTVAGGITTSVAITKTQNIYGWTCDRCGAQTATQGEGQLAPGQGDLDNAGVGPTCPRTQWERLDA